MIPYSVLPALAHWFHLTPADVQAMSGIEVWTFVSAIPEKDG